MLKKRYLEIMHFFYYDFYDHTITLPWSSLSTLLSVCLSYAQAWKKRFLKKYIYLHFVNIRNLVKIGIAVFFLEILMDDRRQTRTIAKGLLGDPDDF